MELDRNAVYTHWRQRFAWWNHYLKAMLKHKERNRVQMLSKFIPADSVIFDVGAHFGYIAKEFCRIHNSTCSVYCFEPVEYTYSILRKIMSNYSNSHIEKIALSDSNTKVRITIPVKESGRLGIGLSHLGEESNRDYITEEIPTIKLDDYFYGKNIQKLNFIKCDVEGAEHLVFTGGSEAIKEFKPVIYTEIKDHFTQRIGRSAKDVINYIESFGYTSNYIQNGRAKPIDTYQPNIEDYLFLPK